MRIGPCVQVDRHTSGVMMGLATIEQLFRNSAAVNWEHDTYRANITCSDVPLDGGEYEEYQVLQYTDKHANRRQLTG